MAPDVSIAAAEVARGDRAGAEGVHERQLVGQLHGKGRVARRLRPAKGPAPATGEHLVLHPGETAVERELPGVPPRAG